MGEREQRVRGELAPVLEQDREDHALGAVVRRDVAAELGDLVREAFPDVGVVEQELNGHQALVE
ncbi:hypothetical protein GCM10009854_44140 [Saccharopolyspora halophila]|uniref:Uncharacterized protein n=1 Tax=Saccharopolyspora halophila TaxID=405551 RepID=A0ABN3GT19_9PSEU